MLVGHIDLDAFKYAAASVGEDRSVLVTHKASGRSISVKSRTEFYGHYKKKEGGKLAEINKGRESPFLWDEFEYEDVQKPQPIANVLHTVKLMVEKAIQESKADKVVFYIGEGESFRVNYSTLLEYKGNRKELLRPILLDEVVEYLKKKYSPEVVTYYEVDDVVTMNTWGKKNHFIIGEDKDYYGAGTRFFNLRKPEEGVVDCTGFGKLWLDDKEGVRGTGRLFKLWQACSNDASDNYAANCVSKIRWGEKKAYQRLHECKDDKEAFQEAVNIFKHLYPEPFECVGWKGDTVKVDWIYVFSECLNLCHLHRNRDDDFIDVVEVLENLGVDVGEGYVKPILSD